MIKMLVRADKSMYEDKTRNRKGGTWYTVRSSERFKKLITDNVSQLYSDTDVFDEVFVWEQGLGNGRRKAE